ncbi:hypothetical protein CANINC_000868 [Pichia inconspicua]|uniref:DNA repair metallo-beta-lactamase domain-containing protein n=1 Tax=Pichia inconspicua TaxID=52247 RepID=A0A4T0X5D1_9ASCO|nr:hypothetical protein CANINC_000868 [[Candida] inconspicua]
MNINKLASTFQGQVELISDILIDDFSYLKSPKGDGIKYCFISHAHSDHYKGLSEPFTSCPQIITTLTTKLLIQEQNKNSFNMQRNLLRCREIKFNETLELEPNLNVTFIPNFHCLGSAMIMITDFRRLNEVNILYTGDARFEDQVIQSFRTYPSLMPFIYGDKRLDMLYLDTTFAYRNININIIENMNGIYQLIELIKKYPKGTRFRFWDTVYGFEEVWLKVHASITNSSWDLGSATKWIGKIKESVPCNLERSINSIDRINELCESIEDDPFFHFSIGKKTQTGKHVVDLKHAIDLTRDEYEQIYLPKKQDEFTSIFEAYDGVYEGRFLYQNSPLKFYYYKHDSLFFPTHVKFIYSRHSSYLETKQFVDLFRYKPKDLYPITESKVTWHHGFNMNRFYGVPNTTYDQRAHSWYGSCNVEVQTDVNNTNIEDYWSSVRSFNSVSTEADFDFDAIGQDIKNDENREEFVIRKDKLSKYTGHVIQKQIKEKKLRRERFNQNLDVSQNNESNIVIIPLNSETLSQDKVKKRKVMKVTSNLNNILSKLDFI